MTDLLDIEDVRTHWIYRIFDKEDQLLYIGCAQDVDSRLRFHFELSVAVPTSWEIARCYARHTSEKFATKALARIAEREAIRLEAPLLNRQHNPSRFKKVNNRYVAIAS